MRNLIAALLYALLLGAHAAESTPGTGNAGCTPATEEVAAGAAPSELVILDTHDCPKADAVSLRMGETLRIRATGQTANEISELVRKEGRLTLHLQGVPMTGIVGRVEKISGKPDAGLILLFDLDRRSEADDNRRAWDELLKKAGGYDMELKPSIAIGNVPAQPVKSTFRFHVATGWSVFWTLAAGFVLFVAAYLGLIRHSGALRDDKDGAYSLGKSQMAFWGLIVLLTFVGVWVMTGSMERVPSQVLILLGISGATGLGAIVIGQNNKASTRSELEAEQKKLEDEQLAAAGVLAPGSQQRLAEIRLQLAALAAPPARSPSRQFFQDICNDGNGLSFHRLQVVIWTLVLGVIFVRTVAQVMSMPEFQENLLILMGISSGTYLGFKFPEKS